MTVRANRSRTGFHSFPEVEWKKRRKKGRARGGSNVERGKTLKGKEKIMEGEGGRESENGGK